MKLFKISSLFFSVALAAAIAPALTSCSDDNDNDKTDKSLTCSLASAGLQYGSDNIWTGWDKQEDLKVGEFIFSHSYEGYPFGFTAARIADNAEYPDMMNHQFEVITGGGPGGKGTAYIVGNWDAYQESMGAKHTCKVTLEKKADGSENWFIPESVKVTNTSYAYYTMLNGNAFARKFQEGDYLTLIVHGVVYPEERTIQIPLADCKGDPQGWFLKGWTEFDLTKLGKVREIYFSMASSDTGLYGMNTPAYFAIDDLKVRKVE